jgi:nucleoside-diphosphate-sugar epimerase
MGDYIKKQGTNFPKKRIRSDPQQLHNSIFLNQIGFHNSPLLAKRFVDLPTKIKSMHVAVTGANGFTGSYLVKMLLLQGASVRALVRSEKSKNELLHFLEYQDNKNLQFFFGDVTHKEDLPDFVTGMDVVFHTAAYVSFNPREKEIIHEINVSGTRNLVNALLQQPEKSAKLVHFSSIAALGDAIDNKPVTEENVQKEFAQQSHYSHSKYLAELEVWRGIEEGLNAVILNPAVILGFTESNRSSSALINQMTKGFPFVTSGSTGFVSVSDVCRAAIMLAKSDIQSERFVLCSDNLSYPQLFRLVQTALGKNRKPRIINKNVLWLLGITNELIARLFFQTPKLTRRIARSGYKHSRFCGKKITHVTGFQYSNLEGEIKRAFSESRQPNNNLKEQ